MAEKLFKVGIDLNGNQLKNLGDPSVGTDGVNLNYLTNFVNGRTYKAPVRAASTANLTLATPGASIDGVTLSSGDRILLKNQSTGSQNGIYVWTGASTLLTRATDADSSAEVTGGMTMVVMEGTVSADKEYMLTTDGAIVLGTTALTFTLVNTGGTTYTADGNGLELTSTTFGLELDGTTLAKSSSGLRIGSGAAGAGLVESSGVLAVGAGTGITVNADDVAINTSLTARWKSVTAGNGSLTTLTLTHNLGNPYHIAQAQDASTGEEYECKIIKGSNSTTYEFQVAPLTNTIVLVAIG